jgi:glycosyltransferase involved in cell wall biosynthesis
LVHLNSVGLSNPASALMKVKFPFVWHVREHGPKHQGRRFKFISRRLAEAPQVIFLSKAEQSSWLGGNSHGTVVHNFIDFSQFDSSRSGDDFKEKCRIPKNHKVILYVGGKKRHKGIIELLYSLTQLKREWGADFTCLMPDTFLNRSEPLTRIEKQIDALIRAGGLEDNCRLMPFNPDIVDMFACCDVLVFPATKPHFARPVIEASAMSKPVIASDLRAVDELVLDGETGFLVPSENIEILTQRLIEILSDNKLAERLGHAGKVFALREFEFHSQVRKILRCYEHALRKE